MKSVFFDYPLLSVFILLFGIILFVCLVRKLQLHTGSCYDNSCTLIPAIIVTVIGYFVGMDISNVPHSGMEVMPYATFGILFSPVVYIVSIYGNALIFFFCISWSKKIKKKLGYAELFVIGMFAPVLVDVLFWMNIDWLMKL